DVKQLPPPVVLDIQKQMVDNRLQLDHTEAGRFVHSELQTEMEKKRHVLGEVRHELREAEDLNDDPDEIEELRRAETDLVQQSAQLEQVVKEFNVIQEVVAGLV